MNKAEVKQIILEEIYSALKEIKNSKSLNENYDPKKMASIIRKDIGQGDEEDNKIIDPILKKYASKIENASPNKVGDLLNDLEKELNKELEDITNTASSYISAYKDKKSTNENESESLNELSSDDRALELAVSAFLDEGLYQEIDDPTAKDPEARAVRKYDLNINKVARFSPDFANMDVSDQRRAIAEFMIKVINVASARQGKGAPKKFFEKQDLINVVKLLQKGEFSSQDLVDAVSYFTRPQQANKLLAAWKEKGWVTFPETKPSVTRLRPDRPRLNLGDLDLDEHIKNYVYSYLKESASPFNNKLKEIEATGKIAALEAKLNAVEEMVNAANERLSRIDEDEEFSEMMDKGKVNSMRSEVKQLEKTREKLQKEYAKTKNGKKSTKEPVMDEDKDIDLEENSSSIELNESISRMQKLAGL
jgi:hypothetical protein